MKTKIIYISGNELFDIADIRAAFDEVRVALSLDNDTILFGVPVDKENALEASQPTPEHLEPVVQNIVEPVIDTVIEEIETTTPLKEPEPQPSHKKPKIVPISVVTPKVEDQAETTKPVEQDEPQESAPSVVPILSVLGSKTEEKQPEEIVETIDTEPVENVATTESVSIDDMIADEVPTDNTEKTLEELLESMAPLGEDTGKAAEPIAEPDVAPIDSDDIKTNDDIDMTLEKLATEFVETQDKLESPTKPATRGKIGKLKNILPFKKAKHDDSGLMGDLFGWAGVAANDEDFTIPGFFTNAASKK